MNLIRTFACVLSVATALAAQAPYAFHFEFDQPGVLPSATPGVGVFNATGSATSTLFGANCGVLQMDTTVNPTLGAGFFGGTYGVYGTAGPGLDPNLPAFLESRFTLIGGTGGPGTFTNSTGVLGIFPGINAALIVNVVTGEIGLMTGSGVMWTTPTGSAYIAHTYRIETFPLGPLKFVQLYIDGVLVIGPVLGAPTVSADAWAIGDTAGSHSISIAIDFEYLSVSQGPIGPGQANSADAALFVNRSETTPQGMLGLQGPFPSVAPGGSTLTLEWSGPAYAPYVLFVGPQNPANTNFGCIGWLDIATPGGYLDLSIIFDPFAPFIGPLFRLDACGKAQQTFSVPPWTPGTPLANFQGGVFGGACGLTFTAAHYVTT